MSSMCQLRYFVFIISLRSQKEAKLPIYHSWKKSRLRSFLLHDKVIQLAKSRANVNTSQFQQRQSSVPYFPIEQVVRRKHLEISSLAIKKEKLNTEIFVHFLKSLLRCLSLEGGSLGTCNFLLLFPTCPWPYIPICPWDRDICCWCSVNSTQ